MTRTRHFMWHIASSDGLAGTSRSRFGNAGRCDMLVAEVTQSQDILGSLRSRAPAMWCRSRRSGTSSDQTSGGEPDVVRRGAE